MAKARGFLASFFGKKEPYDVYIGKDGTREEVIEKYRKWILSKPRLIECLPELKDKVLGCWCKPEIYHNDVLVELVMEYT